MKRFLQVFYIIFSAALLSLGIPSELFPFGSAFYGLIALIPFYYAYTKINSYLEGALLFALHAFIVHMATSFWLAYFKDFAALTLGASALGTSLEAYAIGMTLFLPLSLHRRERTLRDRHTQKGATSLIIRVLWFSSVYVIYEWKKSIGFLGYPWGVVSSSFFNAHIFMQLAEITGTYGLTFMVALFSGLVVELYTHYKDFTQNKLSYPVCFGFLNLATVFLIFAFFIYVFGAVRYLTPVKPTKFLNAVFVQQNEDPWKSNNDDDSIMVSQKLTDQALDSLTEDERDEVDLVVWSEGCLKYSFPRAQSHYKFFPSESPLIPYIQKKGLPFILGGSYVRKEKPREVVNAALLFDERGNFIGPYGKNHLVPLAEAVPFVNIPGVGDFLKSTIGISAGWSPGDQYVYFDIKGRNNPDLKGEKYRTYSLIDKKLNKEETRPPVHITVPICYDNAFPDVIRPFVANGSELLLTITDDSWSQKNSSELQHFVVASFRSIEYRTTLAVSSNAGYSCVVDCKGNVIDDLPLFEACSKFTKIPIYSHRYTTYLLFGNWLPLSLFIIGLLYSVYMYRIQGTSLEVRSERKKLDRFSRRLIKKGLNKKG